MEPFQRRPGAGSDVKKLEQGLNRADVALKALEESALTQEQALKLKALLQRVSAPSATTSRTFSKIMNIRGHQAVLGQISVKGRLLDTLLTEGSFNKNCLEQIKYAELLGNRIATRAENLAYVGDLLAKEQDKTISNAEKYALETYRQRYVRDTVSGLFVRGQRVCASNVSFLNAGPSLVCGALFVRASG